MSEKEMQDKTYREPVLPADWGKECEFRDDGKEWITEKLQGYDKDGNHDLITWVSENEYWGYARIEVTEQPG